VIRDRAAQDSLSQDTRRRCYNSLMMIGPRTFTFLGTGTSVGVPMVGCRCDVCRSTDPRNHRYRCAVLIGTPDGNILVDTPPELRLQLLREQAERLDAVLYTHYHADHLFGLDDLRPFAAKTGQSIPLYCTEEVEGVIRRAFDYAFTTDPEKVAANYLPRLFFRQITAEPFTVLGQQVTPIPLAHSFFNVFGFRIGDVAYCTDVSEIPRSSWPRLEGLRVLVIDALRYEPHPAHFGLNQALDVIAQFRPQRAYLTHMSHAFDHEALSRQLPPNVQPAYDGLRFEF
jgi:phosphoribosyl 1,2-cyclic phosphate phosphodiesterase